MSEEKDIFHQARELAKPKLNGPEEVNAYLRKLKDDGISLVLCAMVIMENQSVGLQEAQEIIFASPAWKESKRTLDGSSDAPDKIWPN